MMASQGKSKLANKFITLCYDNFPIQREFVFAMKGRPFSMLSSQSLPVPSVSLIDFNLVNDLGLKMSDLQCAKFSFGGQKLRILGRISQTVQTITDGVISGTVHIRANVVEDLRKTFDCHSIAGKKMTEMLSNPSSSATSTAEQSLAQPKSPTKSPRCSQSSPTDKENLVTSSAEKSPAPVNSPRCSRGSWASVTSEASISTSSGASDTSGSPRAAIYRSSHTLSSPAPPPGRTIRGSLPPLSTPKPLGKHYRTNWSAPQPKEALSRGIPRRTIPLRPDNSHCYARVVSIVNKLSRKMKDSGKSLVELEYKDAATGFILTANSHATINITQGLQVGDAVLFKQYEDLGRATEDGHMCTNPIMIVYSKVEEEELSANHGAFFPELPPECLPAGYYG